MSEKIIAIEDTSFNTGDYSEYDGFVISTSEQVIKVGISNFQFPMLL